MATALALQPLAPKPWQAPVDFMEQGTENIRHFPNFLPHSPTLPSGKERRRKERPCDGCRRRKSKCVLQDSRRCALCEFHKQECTFVEDPQPRKRKLDDHSHSEGPPKKSPVTTSSSTVGSSPRTHSQTSYADSALGSAPTWHPQAPHTKATPTFLPHDDSLSLQRHRHCKYLGRTTALDAALIGLGSFNSSNETLSRIGTLRRVTSVEYFSTHADAEVPIANIDEAQVLTDLEATVGAHGPALVDLYFRTVHPSYPIIQKHIFLNRQRHDAAQFNPPLLAAMYLLALSWWGHDAKLSQHPKPDVARLEYIAMTSLAIAMQRPSISAVQAGLLVLQRSKTNTWPLTVQLVALGQDLGLHLDCTDWAIPVWERRLRKRLAWALYMQDKWSALTHGRPSHIHAADWAVPAASEADFDETLPSAQREEVDDATAKGRVLFMQMISLTAIMAEVCSNFYSQSAQAEYARAGSHATTLVLNWAKPVQLKLRDWFMTLPPECKMDALTPGTLCSNGYLHLGYFATEISIHRRIVQSLDSPTTTSTQLFMCRNAAKARLISAMDFVNRLRPEHLDAFWVFPSAANFALIGTFGALLMVSSPGKEEAVFYEARLREFRWTLGVSAKKAPWIAEAVGLLEANGEMLAGLPEKETVGNNGGARVGGRTRAADAFVLGDDEEMETESWAQYAG